MASNSLSSGDITKSSGSPLDASTPGIKCSNCHSFGAISNNSASVTLAGFSGTTWSAGTSYSLTLTVPLGAAGQGFLLTAENATAKQGTYTNLNASTEKLITTGELGHQNAARSTVHSWNFTWTGPAAGAGQICFYAFSLSDSQSTSGNAYFNSWCYVESVATAPTITTPPAAQTVNDGQTATFAVVAAGSGLTYQWQKAPSGTSTYSTLSGATIASYTTPATTVADSGSSFKCVVTNAGGSVTSGAAALTVNAIVPILTAQPSASLVLEGQAATFSITATGGSAALSYQWQKAPSGSGTYAPISGATAASYTTPATVLTDGGSTFKCVVTSAGGSVTSNSAALSVNPAPPAITTQPAAQSVVVGQTPTFGVTASGSQPLSYQWQKAPSGSSTYSTISGATVASYTTPAAVAGDNGSNFKCVVTNAAGSATSNAAALTVSLSATAPSITVQPASQNVTAGQAAAFTVSANGTAPLSFQWQKAPSGSSTYSAVSGATATGYTTPSTVVGDSGSNFRCVVTNALGSATSNPATLTVGAAAPAITIQPAPLSVSVGQTATFTISASGTAPLGFQWQKAPSGSSTYSAVSGATATGYTTPATVVGDSGSNFRCVVTNAGGSVTSSAATLTVSAVAPAITVQPMPQSVTEGQTAVFSVTATGTSLTYQWQKAASGSASYAAIAGATSSSYTTPATVLAADSGSAFECVVSNGAGTVASAPALLTVSPATVTQPPSITQQPANQRVPLGLAAIFSVTVANPADPALLYQWFRNGQPVYLNANNPTYTIPAVTMADNGAYFYCLLTNAIGSITSAQAKLLVANALVPPQIGNYQPVMSLGYPLQISTPYSVPVMYNWTFTYTGPAASAPGLASANTGQAIGTSVLKATPSNSLVPAALNLTPGKYQVSVQATDAFGDASSPTTENVTFLASDLSGAGVFPNPWRAGRSANPYITFTGLTMNASVKIFTAAGQLVKRFDASGDSAQWFLINDSGDKVASGLYIYLITDGQGDKKRGKLAVIR